MTKQMEMSQPVYANINYVGTQEKMGRTGRNQTGSDSVKTRSSRAAPVCLVLLCFLLLTAVIVLCVFVYTNITNYTQERNQLLTTITNITEERDELLTWITNLTEERRQLLTKNTKLAKERAELQSKITSLTEGQNKLKKRNDELSNVREQLFKQIICKKDGSFYFMSNEMKNWDESRKDCTERGADLIIINDKEEHDFVMNITRNKEFWIGLTDSKEEDTWKWVDGTSMTSVFWGSNAYFTEPNGGRDENCAVTYLKGHPDILGWLDVSCNGAYQWICEKKNLTLQSAL